jgi:crotonobetainyl-CoA:carnitine CoA-transferase CaiB-like acyl-CoA transferase
MTASPPPLTGIRVLSLEQYGAGPYCSMHLADMGAEVIKIEDPKGGDTSRQTGPHFLSPGNSHFFHTFNLGKRSLALDMRAPGGRAVFERLVAGSDVVMNNLRGDQPGKLGLTYDVLGRINPRIVCGHLSGYGRTGERATWPAYDYLAQAEAGLPTLTGEPGSPYTRFGLPVIDFLTGLTLAVGIASALVGALKTGRGRDVDVTLYDVAMHQLTYPATWYLNEGDAITRRPRSGHPSVVPCELFPTKDGQMFLMCILPKFWEALCDLTGLGALPADPRFATPEARFANREALVALIDAALATRTTAEWMAVFAGRVPAAPVLTIAAALDNPYFAATGGLQTVDHPDRAGMRVVSNPIRLDGARRPARPAPRLGADTDAVLAEAGFGGAEIADLRASGTVGARD